jgi:hypothetical protein
VQGSNKKYGKIWGNSYFGCFLGLLLSFGAALAFSWPYKILHLHQLLRHNYFNLPLFLAFCFCVQMLSVVIMVSDLLSDEYQWENNFIKRFILQAIFGYAGPIAVVVSMTYMGILINDHNLLSTFYSRHFFSLAISILFAFNVLVSAFKHLEKKSADEPEAPIADNTNLKKGYTEYVWLKYGKEDVKLNINQIAYFQLIGKDMLIHCHNHMEYTCRISIKKLISTLDPAIFLQANRNHIISQSSLSRIKNREDGGSIVYLKNRTGELAISISRHKRETAIVWMEESGLRPSGPAQKINLSCLW